MVRLSIFDKMGPKDMRIKIGHKLVAGFLLIISLMVAIALYLVIVSRKSMQEHAICLLS